MLLSIMLSFYVTTLVCFSFVSHPVYYCLLLLVNSLSVCGIVYSLIGFGWYLILLGLVCIGGVYILFLFVSVFSPNFILGYGLNVVTLALIFVFFMLTFFSLLSINLPIIADFSYYLCSYMEGLSYLIFCLVLVLGFLCVSVIVNRKDSFYR